MDANKVCSICGQEFPLAQFPTNRGMKDGHLGKCFECWAIFTSDKECVLAVAERKAHKEVIATPEPIEPEPIEEPKAAKRPRRLTEEERKERQKLYAKRWYERHKEEQRERCRAYSKSEHGREVKNAHARKAYAKIKADPEAYAVYLAKITASQKERWKDPIERQKRRARSRAYYAANKDKWVKYNAKKYEKVEI